MTLTVCIPYSMIEPIRSKLDSGFQSDQGEEDNVWGNRFRENIKHASVNLLVQLGNSDMTVREFLKLKVGDIVQLDQECNMPLDVRIEGVAKFKGFQGSYKGNQAIKISKKVYVPPATSEFE